MSLIETSSGQIASIDVFNPKLSRVKVFSNRTYGNNKTESELEVAVSLVDVSDQFAVPSIGGCRTHECADEPSTFHVHTRCIATANYFNLIHQNTILVDVSIKY